MVLPSIAGGAAIAGYSVQRHGFNPLTAPSVLRRLGISHVTVENETPLRQVFMMRAINAVLKFTELSEDSIIDAGGASLDRGSNAWAAPDIQDRKITIVEFKDRMFRIHAIHQSPIHFGTSGHHRFDSPDGSYGVVYAGRDEYLCIH